VIEENALGRENPQLATSIYNLAGLYQEQGRYAEAEPLLKRSLAISEKAFGPEHPDVASSLNNLASVYHHQGRYVEAELLLKRSLSISEKALGPKHPDLAPTLNNLAELYRDQGRYLEAAPFYQRSLSISEKALGPEHPNIAHILNNLAGLYDGQNRYAEAEPLYKRALAIREKALGLEHPDVAASLYNLAFLYRERGHFEEAEALNYRSLGIWERAFGPENLDVSRSLNNLAKLYEAQGRYAEALGFSRRAVSILEKHLGKLAVEHDSSAPAEQRMVRPGFIENVALLYHAGEPNAAAEGFRVVQMAETSSAGTAIAAMTARLAAGGGAHADVIRERQDLVQQLRALDDALVKAVSKPTAEHDAATETSLRAGLDETSKKIDALDARIAAESPDFAELSNPKPIDALAAQALLAPDEALLVYLTSDKATWLWVLRRDRIVLQHIPFDAKALAREVSALRRALDPESNPDLAPFPAIAAYRLHDKILGFGSHLLEGVHHLLVVPDGALESLPLSVLVTRPPEHDPETPADHRDIAWLAQDYAVTVLPSVSSLRGLRQFANAEHASAPFLGIGDPVLKGPTLASLFSGTVADVEAVRELPPLPETAEELRTIARTLGATDDDLLLAERAIEPVLRKTPLDHYRVVAFATHGLMSGEKGFAEPALVLTPPAEATAENDGLLTASKIATLKFNADWVVLSACNTAAGDGTPDAGGLSGLAKAFFYAGARSLLVSHWFVRSGAAVKLVTGTFDMLKLDPTIGRAEALRRAEMAMLDRANPPEFAHPMAWAPFVLAGEGGAGR
jgi:CHAT domain-containing protein/tetratricopeptide (TPR) repeat protein